MPVKQNTSITNLKRYNQALHYGLIPDGTGEHYRTKLYKLEHLDPRSKIWMDTMDPRSIYEGHNGPKINMMEAGIYEA